MSATQQNNNKAQSAAADKTALEIDVIMEGGVIQEILGIPPGARVRVIDYDTEGADPDDLSESPYDHEAACFLGIYTGTPTGYRFSRDASLPSAVLESVGYWKGHRAAQAHADKLAEALRDVELRTTQARLASGIGKRKNRTEFLLGELERIAGVARQALAWESAQ